jgi:hypothetical protein
MQMAETARKFGPLTPHQRRVIAALSALEDAHGYRWWSRVAIGYVVGAGGFHDTIQIKTIALLKARGMVLTQRSSWSEETKAAVSCNCGCWHWGLTALGREEASRIAMRWPESALQRVHTTHPNRCHRFLDEDDEQDFFRGSGDDDDDDDSPRPRSPVGPGLVHA